MYKIKTKVMAVLVLGLGFLTACSSNDDLDNGGTGTAPNGSTYMSVAINLATGSGTRADNQADTEQGEEPKNNFVGKWAGKDKINAIDVYVFNNTGALEIKQPFAAGEFDLKTPAGDKTVTIVPSKGIKVMPGLKTVYVVVNPTTETRAFLDSENTLANFELKYQNLAEAPANWFAPEVKDNLTANVKTAADKIASVDDNDNTDVITMTVTQPATAVDVKENVSQANTLSGNTTNRAHLTVKRAVARVMVTTTKGTFDVVGDDPLTQDVEDDAVLGKVTNIRYVVGQGEKSIYFMQAKGADADLTYKTPHSAYVPNLATEYTWTTAGAHYDYSGLWKGNNPGGISGVEVPTAELYNSVATTALDKISANLVQKLNGEFILPNTHKWGESQDVTHYRKGNTAYVLVRAQFEPKKVVMADGSIKDNYSYGAGKTFYMGANGVFYESVTAANTAKALDGTPLGVPGQTAAKYEKGKTLYFAWVNPDKTGLADGNKWLNSPVNRNNIYHIEISGFKRIGANWNPLVPNHPDHPDDPTNNPNNPDPKPGNEDPQHPNEPNEPPVNPEDPLTPKETWMSVDTKILPWNVHSYSVILDI